MDEHEDPAIELSNDSNSRPLRWWEDKVDEILIGLFITVICCAAFMAPKETPAAAYTVASAGVGGLCVYISNKVKQAVNGNGG